MAIVFQLGSGPQVRRSASRASSPSRTRSQTRPAYAAPVPADHGADVTGGERELSHQSHEHRRPHRPRERVAKGRTRVVERGAGGEGPHTGGRAARGRWSGRLATVRIASVLADRSQTVSRITDSTAGTARTSSPSRTRSATRPAARSKVKSEAQVSMRTGMVRAEVAVPTAELALVQAAASDVRAARGGEGAG